MSFMLNWSRRLCIEFSIIASNEHNNTKLNVVKTPRQRVVRFVMHTQISTNRNGERI